MRRLCVFLGILSCLAVLVSRMSLAVTTAVEASLADGDVRNLLQEIERIRAAGDAGDCAGLQPIPLYPGAPALDDWVMFCNARVTRDTAACGRLPAMIDPDLRSLCRVER